ncbi:MAG: hypothetical protein V1246_04475 [Arenicellales bacterium]|jgi:hypothetical protein|nr:hypothetical protein [Arenicellales bacterium]MDP6312688.1 hypothetical protein [Arenicellales bacterium]MEE1567046.1 hypothetical protein [Arenicellales bacterium]
MKIRGILDAMKKIDTFSLSHMAGPATSWPAAAPIALAPRLLLRH